MRVAAAFARNEQPADMRHFFDIGSNIGQTFDDYLLKRHDYDGARVWCFEPSPRHVPALMEKAASVAGRFSVVVCPFGFRGQAGAIQFHQKDDPRGDSFERELASSWQTHNVATAYELRAAALELGRFILENVPPSDTVTLKLDCEGSEYEILTALAENADAVARVDHFMVEWHTIGSPHATREEIEAAFRDKYRMEIAVWGY